MLVLTSENVKSVLASVPNNNQWYAIEAYYGLGVSKDVQIRDYDLGEDSMGLEDLIYYFENDHVDYQWGYEDGMIFVECMWGVNKGITTSVYVADKEKAKRLLEAIYDLVR